MRQERSDKIVNIYFKGKAGLSVFSLEEIDRCELWMEVAGARVSPATLRGISAGVSLIREVMSREDFIMRSYESSYKKLVEMCKRAGLSVFRLVEAARCELYVEARMVRLSSAAVKGVSALISLIREVRGLEDDVSGRERVMKKTLIRERVISGPRKGRENQEL